MVLHRREYHQFFVKCFKPVLGRHLRMNGLTSEVFGKRIGVDKRTVDAWRQGDTLPSASNISMMYEELGAVFLNDVLAIAGYTGAHEEYPSSESLVDLLPALSELMHLISQNIAQNENKNADNAAIADACRALIPKLGGFMHFDSQQGGA